MENINSLTLAQLVKTNHKAGIVFEKYHLDFCCKGKRTLEQACTEQQLPITEVVSELETVFSKGGCCLVSLPVGAPLYIPVNAVDRESRARHIAPHEYVF